MTNLERLISLPPGHVLEFGHDAANAGDGEVMAVQRRGSGFYGSCGSHDFGAFTAEEAAAKLTRRSYTRYLTTRRSS